MLLKIKEALSNECGGPSVEALIGIWVSLLIVAALFIFIKSVYIRIYELSGFVSAYEL